MISATAENTSSTILPPDPDGRNEMRAFFAGQVLKRFRALTRVDHDDALCDLLVNLMHYCDRHGFGFQRELERATWHYEAETGR
jgi:hypothetical protein